MIGPDVFIIWTLVGTFGAICLFILVLLARVMLRRSARSDPAPNIAPRRALGDLLWTLAPAIVVAIVAIPSLRLLYFQNAVPAADLTVNVTGKMWHWTYEYPDSGNFSFDSPMLTNAPAKSGELDLAGADNHIVVPVGKTVRLVAIGTNLIYGWAIPSIGAKVTGLPGLNEQSWFKADKEGVYYGEASELCGLLHSFKPIQVEVVSRERFDRWLAEAKQRFAAGDTPAVPSFTAAVR